MSLDLRHALRRLRRSPRFTVAAALTLGLGIAASTAAFAIVDAVLVRPPAYRAPDRLVWIWSARVDRDRAFFSIPDFLDVARRARTLEGIAGVAPWGVNLSTATGPAERLAGARMTPAGFAVLGATAALGRLLGPEDGAGAVVLGDALWRRRFGADPRIVGQQVVLDGEAHTVVGVLRASFQLPVVDTDVVAPLDLAADPRREQRGSNFLRAFARLAPDATLARARADLAGIARDLAVAYPETDAKLSAPRLVPIEDELAGRYRSIVALLAAAVLAVLGVAAANFAALALARAAARRDELAIRWALGASRARLARLLFVEAALVAAAAGAVGALAAPWLLAAMRAAVPGDLPRAATAAIGARELGFAAAAAGACALLLGVAPALRPFGAARPRRRLRAALTVAQLAVSLVLMASAGQLARAAARVAAIDPGFDPRDAIAVRFALPRPRYARTDDAVAFLRRLAERAAALPGVERAAVASLLPLSGANARTDFFVAGRPAASAAEMPGAQWRFVGPAWLATAGIPLRAGRDFTAADDARGRPVAIVDAALARRFAVDVGTHLVLDDGVRPRDVEVVGIAGDVAHFRLEDGATPTVYLPIEQLPPAAVGALAANASLVVRLRAGTPPPALDQLVAGLDPGVAASAPRPLAEQVAAALAARRLALALVAIFAAATLVLAALGLAALVATTVAEDTRAIGVRLALGGTAGAIVRGVVAAAARLVFAGLALGLAGAVVVGRATGEAAAEPLPALAAAAALAVTGLVAAWIPARRAAAVDPMVALRAE
jgi:putative ABC transport system permease protein